MEMFGAAERDSGRISEIRPRVTAHVHTCPPAPPGCWHIIVSTYGYDGLCTVRVYRSELSTIELSLKTCMLWRNNLFFTLRLRRARMR